MEPFPPTQEPDEGYSEAPLNSSIPGSVQDSTATLALWPSSEIPALLAAQMPKLTVEQKKRLAMLILNDLPTTIIADIVMTQLNPRLYINFARYLPPEICLKILGYLDATSLIRVALCCRGWYELASDRKLWEKLYYLEGWKAVVPEIVLAEERINGGLTASQIQIQRIMPVEGGHVARKRALSDPASRDEDTADAADDDYQMVDADASMAHEYKDTPMTGVSLFGGPQTEVRNTGAIMKSPSSTPRPKDDSGSRADKGKGKAMDQSPHVASPLADASNDPARLPKSTLWIYDWRDQRYKISWKYLYSMRRRLESNWERGRYTNFQLPHPDHPDEGHNECIYSLQYNSEYLVSGSRDRTLRIWNLHSRRLVRPPLAGHNGSVLCLQFDSDPQEDLIVSGSSDSDVILWRFSTGEILQRLKKAHKESVLNVKFDKRILVTCSKDKTIKIFNRQPLRPGDLGYGDPQGVSPVPVNLRNYGYDDSPLNQMAITPPYTMIACLDGHGAAVNAVQICDREIVSASGDRNIRLWDWPNQVVKRTFIGHSKGIACVQYDGRRIVSGSSDNEVKVFDCESGLEVASLRAHSNLVRTVQAGFGDLPYSREEDQLEARAVDKAYFDAVDAGALSEARPGQRRPYNPGSRRPEDITAYGAKLPPGGGGGPYGRIVSGSYDQSIIIWRRDREGAWRSSHVLRQEEGAAAALKQSPGASTSAGLRRPSPAVASGANIARPRTDQLLRNQPPPPQPTNMAPTSQSLLQRPQPFYTQVEHPIHATITPQTTASYTQMIDSAVPQGPAALQAALNSFPTMLTYNSHIQSAIDREPDAMTRSQLRQVVSTSLVRARIAQHRLQESVQHALTAEAGPSHSHHASSYTAPPRLSQPMSLSQLLNSDPPGPSMIPGTNTGGGPPPTMANGVHTHHPHQTIPPQAAPQPFGMHIHHPGQSQTMPTVTHSENRDLNHGQMQVQLPALAHPQVHSQTHPQVPAEPRAHPHVAEADASPARIFKLQFDARRIICCSQVSTIVGWDFCNGDAELEEVSKFFGTVE
ncbi:putative F-box WD repeat-containing protein 1A [Rosellinia necatrix]|uniref:Putative F-box WD repeat-containing protein 1A n=1 Tax=Rosellinia necatrix TaxID=77044 RepID=A0A1W2TUH0_ROSNE|nr:putative F-box WD repeat-containing protein 1A [Rosellinia necatrix]